MGFPIRSSFKGKPPSIIIIIISREMFDYI